MGEVGGLSSSNMLRFTGMASGVDTDSMIKKMLAADKIRISKVEQNKQTLQWKQELYRDIIKDMNGIKSKYFDVLSEDYILSQDKFLQNKVESSNASIANATAYSSSTEGTYKVKVKSLARSATLESSGTIVNNSSEGITDFSKWQGAKLDFTLDGKATTITLGTSINNMDDLVADINTKLNDNTDLKGKMYVSSSSDKLKFNFNGSSDIRLVDAKQSDGSTALDEVSSLKDVLLNATRSTKLTALDSTAGFNSENISFDIKYNGTTKTVTLDNKDGSKTINDLMNAINNATEGNVVARYSELTGKFTMMTSKTGVSSTIEVKTNSGSLEEKLLGKLKIDTNVAKIGSDSEVEITQPGATSPQVVKKSNNSFAIDGIQYNLNSESTEEITLNVTSDQDASFKKIKAFIDDYNKMIDKVYKKVEEKRQYNYKPLTEEQKKDMSKEDIEKWETKAKEGLLKNDPDLQNTLSRLRSAFFTPVEGAGISFNEKSLGIGTSDEISDRGKIIIKDEAKFKENLTNNGEQIMRLFVKSSDISYSRTLSVEDKNKRYSEEGIFNRINDILNDSVSPMRDKYGRKAPLLEKAGIEGDVSFIRNTLSKQIEEKEKLINEMTTKMFNKENKYYQMFARLEKAMNGLNAQSNWLYSQMGM